MKIENKGVLLELDDTKTYVLFLRHDSGIKPEDFRLKDKMIIMCNDVDKDFKFVENTDKVIEIRSIK